MSSPTDPNWIIDQWNAFINQIIILVLMIIAFLLVVWFMFEIFPILRDRGSRSFKRFQTIVSEQM